ncbi:MAG: YraN family protein [Cryobacterium sp.]|uniref:YraN family protein n=1 Tax=unclassified Cryobacterium TaxID=2649013 RepID=UPI0018C974C4|nr:MULTISPECIES: YraN family protein [unclassified Cryobacterium]MCY7405385.1 YraN family protein [Cryobacterium sp.]MEC5152889.1 putative endonuclease [Cryobacterium sp. CAN_C3]
MARKDELGKLGEEQAARFLENAGYTILTRNWRCAEGEIDLVVQKGAAVVFVEVKTRSGLSFGHPFEAITMKKLARMRRLAAAWCVHADRWPRQIRLDVIAVIAPAGREPVIEHLQGVF